MDPKIKNLILIGLIFISLSAAGAGLYLYQKEHNANIELKDQIEDLTTKQKIAEAKFLESQNVIASLQAKLKDATTQIDSLNTQLQQEKSEKDDALAKIDQINSDLKMQKELRADLEKKLNQAQSDVKDIQVKLGDMEAERSNLKLKISELEAKSDVELGKIVVNQDVSPAKGKKSVAPQKSAPSEPKVVKKKEEVVKAAPAAPEVKVMVVNKDYNFVVISAGSKDGVDVGDEFTIYHGNTNIGDVKVEKLQEAMSAAGFISDDIKDKVREGDRAVKKTR